MRCRRLIGERALAGELHRRRPGPKGNGRLVAHAAVFAADGARVELGGVQLSSFANAQRDIKYALEEPPKGLPKTLRHSPSTDG